MTNGNVGSVILYDAERIERLWENIRARLVSWQFMRAHDLARPTPNCTAEDRDGEFKPVVLGYLELCNVRW